MAACLVMLSVLVPVAYAQVDTQYIFGPDADDDVTSTPYAPNQNDRFLELPRIERTNIDAFGGVRHDSYDIPYIRAEIRLHNISSLTVNFVQNATITLDPGFTINNHAVNIIGASSYLSWDCDSPPNISLNGGSATNAGPGRSQSLDFLFLPYVRVITEVNDADENITQKRCIAPEGLEDNPRYESSNRGAVNMGGTPIYDDVPAYTPPDGWSIDQESIDNINIMYPADGASIVLTAQLLEDNGARPAPDFMGAPLTSLFNGTITYHEDGDHSGNAIGALSTSCSGIPETVVVFDGTPDG